MPQGGRAADLGSGEGGLMEAVREYITPNAIMETSGGDLSTGGGLMAAPRAGDEVSFTPLLPPRMPPKDVTIGRNWGQVRLTGQPVSARRPFAWP